jgi:hypothetical protein
MTVHESTPPAGRSQFSGSPADPHRNPEGGTLLMLTQVMERGRSRRLQALEDAVAYRRSRLAAPCWECRSAGPGRRCEEHSADIRLIAGYLRDIHRAGLVLGAPTPAAHVG